MGKFFVVAFGLFLAVIAFGSADIASNMRAENTVSLKDTGEPMYDGKTVRDDLKHYFDNRKR